jgi:hypothetical protein
MAIVTSVSGGSFAEGFIAGWRHQPHFSDDSETLPDDRYAVKTIFLGNFAFDKSTCINLPIAH